MRAGPRNQATGSVEAVVDAMKAAEEAAVLRPAGIPVRSPRIEIDWAEEAHELAERFHWRAVTADEIPAPVLRARQIALMWAEHPRRWKKSVRRRAMALIAQHVRIEGRLRGFSVLECLATAKGFGEETQSGPAQFFEPVAMSYPTHPGAETWAYQDGTGKRLWAHVAFVGTDLWINV